MNAPKLGRIDATARLEKFLARERADIAPILRSIPPGVDAVLERQQRDPREQRVS